MLHLESLQNSVSSKQRATYNLKYSFELIPKWNSYFFIQLSDSKLNRTSPGQKEAKIFLLDSVHVSRGAGGKSTTTVLCKLSWHLSTLLSNYTGAHCICKKNYTHQTNKPYINSLKQEKKKKSFYNGKMINRKKYPFLEVKIV